MPYIPPVYESLHQATSQLQQVFNEFSGRYVPLPFETLLDSVIHMEERYRQKVREKGNCFFFRLA